MSAEHVPLGESSRASWEEPATVHTPILIVRPSIEEAALRIFVAALPRVPEGMDSNFARRQVRKAADAAVICAKILHDALDAARKEAGGPAPPL